MPTLPAIWFKRQNHLYQNLVLLCCSLQLWAPQEMGEVISQVWNKLSTEIEEASNVLYFLVGSTKYNNLCFTLEGMCNIILSTKPLKL